MASNNIWLFFWIIFNYKSLFAYFFRWIMHIVYSWLTRTFWFDCIIWYFRVFLQLLYFIFMFSTVITMKIARTRCSSLNYCPAGGTFNGEILIYITFHYVKFSIQNLGVIFLSFLFNWGCICFYLLMLLLTLLLIRN